MKDIHLEMWSIKEEAEVNYEHALEMTEKAGYQGIEFSSFRANIPAIEMKELVKKYHLKTVGIHVDLNGLKNNLDAELDYAKKVGYNMIICPWSDCKTKEGIINTAKFLESCAQKTAKEGVLLGYHNHDQEFNKFDGKYAMDILLENMPTVKFQPDVFWIAYAGVDPLTYLKPLAEVHRICSVHTKELAKVGKDNVYVGQGKIDFASLAKLMPPEKYPYIIEQEEYTTDHFDGICQSYNGLRKVFS